jgi:integrase
MPRWTSLFCPRLRSPGWGGCHADGRHRAIHRASPVAWLQAPEALATSSVFARFATEKGERHIHAATAVAWAAAAPTPEARHRWLGYVVRLARFLRAEDPAHEIPPANLFATPKLRPVPYIYARDEMARILETAGQLRRQKPNPMRRQLYVMLFGLIAATGLRVSEALRLRLGDVLPGGVLHIRETKFNKSRPGAVAQERRGGA